MGNAKNEKNANIRMQDTMWTVQQIFLTLEKFPSNITRLR